MKKVFLIGPMRGVPREKGIDWRIKCQKILKDKFEVVHAYMGREKKETFPDPRGAVIRDKNFILKSDLIIMNDSFKGVSMIGTSMEVLFSNTHHKPIIVFGEAHKGDYWLDTHMTMRVENLEQACDIALKLFS